MTDLELRDALLDAIPYPIVFVDMDHIIRYMNKTARFHYYDMRGYRDLIGKSIFECHNETSREKILEGFERLKRHSVEIFIGVWVNNWRIYMTPVRNEKGEMIGYFERFELNQQK